ncbi:hypothetical protein T484DRAFT_1774085, partial [Baffinella frigidus]
MSSARSRFDDQLRELVAFREEHGTFDDQLRELVAFREEHGTFTVPATYTGGRRLARFASGLGAAKSRGDLTGPGDLTEACVRKLIDVGFFPQNEHTAPRTLGVAYPVFLPTSSPPGPPGVWEVRWALRLGRLGRGRGAGGAAGEAGAGSGKPGRVKGSGGGVEGGDDEARESEPQWRRNLDLLSGFKALHGHADVPLGYPENPWLATWVVMQRKLNRDHALAPHRHAALEAIGFLFPL